MQAILLSRKEVAQLYENRIQCEVEIDENIGKTVIIDIETDDYRIDDNGLCAADLLNQKHPRSRLFGIKIGYNRVMFPLHKARSTPRIAPPDKEGLSYWATPYPKV